MARMRFKCSGTEVEATGSNDLISRERAALLEYLGHAEQKKTAPEKDAACGAGSPVSITRRNTEALDLLALRDAIRCGDGPKVLSPFDELNIPMPDGSTITAVCAYVDEKLARFVFKDCLEQHEMNEEATNKGGYLGSLGRKHCLNIYEKLPEELRSVISPRRIRETNDGCEVGYCDPLWLPSATDVFGSPEWKYWPDEADSFQFPIFQKERDRVKEYGDDGTCFWWLRSVYATYSGSFCGGSTGGGAGINYAYYSYGFAPGFDIA